MKNADKWRRGQLAFNLLHVVRPDLANRIRGTLRDPYYHDERLLIFWTWVEEESRIENLEPGLI